MTGTPAKFGAQGMSLLDFFYLRDTVLPAARSQPSPANTLLAPDPGDAMTKLRLADKDLDGLQAKLDAVAAEPVAYLGKTSPHPCPLLPSLAQASLHQPSTQAAIIL